MFVWGCPQYIFPSFTLCVETRASTLGGSNKERFGVRKGNHDPYHFLSLAWARGKLGVTTIVTNPPFHNL